MCSMDNSSDKTMFNGSSPGEGKINRIKGLLFPPYISRSWVEEGMKNMALHPDDIWVVSYPKSGTTWTQQIVKLINSQGIDDDRNLDESFPWVEGFNNDPILNYYYTHDVDGYPSPRTFKSHFPYDLMPCGLPSTTPGRYIYVARNPKDVAVSYYHHCQRQIYYPLKLQWDEYFKASLIDGILAYYGDYFDHVLSWWKHRNDPNVLFIKYEDMKKDLPSSVSKIARFLGSNIGENTITKIAELTKFENMKKTSTANHSWGDGFIFLPNTSVKFMRKGIVGDWKNYFTSEQSAQIDSLYEEKLLSAGLEFDFE